MTQVTFIQADGSRQSHDVPPTFSVMEGAMRNGVPGIEAECGGCISCATCHVHIDEAWTDRVGPPGEIELEMLGMVDGARENSRLSCQIKAAPELDGLVVHVPASQTSVSL